MNFGSVPVVLDVGSSTTRAGFANRTTPTLIFPTIVSNINGDTFIGNDAKTCGGTMRRVIGGYVSNWNHMESIWQFIFNKLKIEPEDHAVVSTYPYYPCTTSHNETMAQIMFEKFNVPALHLTYQPVLSLYSYGRLSGLVVHSGFTETQIYSIYEGHNLHRVMLRGFRVAGEYLTESLSDRLEERGLKYDFDTVNEIKEKMLYISQDPQNEAVNDETFTFPDGKTVHIGKERYTVPEELFTQSFNEYGRLQDFVVGRMYRCDPELRKDLFMNIVLSGGTTLLPGFAQRLEKEVKDECKNTRTFKHQDVKVTAPQNRGICVWVGGAVLASLATFSGMCMTREEYNERGPTLVHTKFF